MRKKYSIFDKEKIVAFIALIVFVAVVAFVIGSGKSENYATCWVMCKTNVNVRKLPDKASEAVGRLDACDSFKTDGQTKNGWVHVMDIGEYGDGWVYVGYVVTEEPKPVFQNYVCVAKRQAACRRWIGGPQITGHKWLKNGQHVSVLYIADGWALTSAGYMQDEWIEVDPE